MSARILGSLRFFWLRTISIIPRPLRRRGLSRRPARPGDVRRRGPAGCPAGCPRSRAVRRDCAPEALIVDALQRAWPADDVGASDALGSLTAHGRVDSGSLLETLAAFPEPDGSWSRAAHALHVHVKTVHSRVRRIGELTGRDLARLEDQNEPASGPPVRTLV
ncbi:helix-turn-helix domain-containing protein [Streptacidiphilus neutrinimicus]|uniref:helix-turn-helix domain-containing protein n=1 Tax=Streptacidiphilus neutrinimicus TaxID=105420 RepID=UPI000693E0B5